MWLHGLLMTTDVQVLMERQDLPLSTATHLYTSFRCTITSCTFYIILSYHQQVIHHNYDCHFEFTYVLLYTITINYGNLVEATICMGVDQVEFPY